MKNTIPIMLKRVKRWSKDFTLKTRNNKWEAKANGIIVRGDDLQSVLRKLLFQIVRAKCTLCGKSFMIPSPQSHRFTCYRHSALAVKRFTFGLDIKKDIKKVKKLTTSPQPEPIPLDNFTKTCVICKNDKCYSEFHGKGKVCRACRGDKRRCRKCKLTSTL